MKRLLAFVTLAAAFVPGCGNVPEAREFNKALVAARQATCACDAHGLFGYSSEAECRAEFPPSEADQSCVEGLFKSLDADFGPHLECRAAAHDRYTACLNTKSCTDLARLGCLGTLNDEVEDCPDLPSEVQADLNECIN